MFSAQAHSSCPGGSVYKRNGNRGDLIYIVSRFTTTSRRHIRRNRSFQYEGPQVPQVTYGKGREGNAFVSQCLPSQVSPVHAKTSLLSLLVLRSGIFKCSPYFSHHLRWEQKYLSLLMKAKKYYIYMILNKTEYSDNPVVTVINLDDIKF